MFWGRVAGVYDTLSKVFNRMTMQHSKMPISLRNFNEGAKAIGEFKETPV